MSPADVLEITSVGGEGGMLAEGGGGAIKNIHIDKIECQYQVLLVSLVCSET